jgi:hypothetical protein
MVVRESRMTKDVFLMAGKEIYKNYENIFGN